jgi:hypothetical protein
MMPHSDVVKAYQRLSTLTPETRFSESCTERTVKVYETPHTRIHLLRVPDAPEQVKVEVEVSLPDPLWGLAKTAKTGEPATPNQQVLCHTLKSLILLHQYLLLLHNAGFTLELVSEEQLWIASLELAEPPTTRLYTLLTPPPFTMD